MIQIVWTDCSMFQTGNPQGRDTVTERLEKCSKAKPFGKLINILEFRTPDPHFLDTGCVSHICSVCTDSGGCGMVSHRSIFGLDLKLVRFLS